MTKISYYSAPGRVCLYGEHQDYLKLKVIPAAIDLRTKISVRQYSSNKILVHSKDMNTSAEFSTDSDIPLIGNEFDYLRAIIKVLKKEDLITSIPGFKVEISSNVPIGSGLSSSAALLVAWLTALNDQLALNLTPEDMADLAFRAESKILGINCGIMDQYASSLGGIFSLDCDGPPHDIIKHNKVLSGLVIGDSLVRRSANEPLTVMKNQIFIGYEKIRKKSEFTFKNLSLEHLVELKSLITETEYKRLEGVVKIREYTSQASKELTKTNNHDLTLLGNLLTKQHEALRDHLEVSIPKLDQLVDVSLQAGALGAKLSGAGFGGCIIVYAPNKEQDVAKAIEKIGGKATICNIDSQGGRADKKKN
ncbi:MAG: galactokinase [Candidatus Heimdallarchaeota archaeon]